MKLALPFLLLATLAMGRAESGQGGNPTAATQLDDPTNPPHTDWRREVSAQFPFAPGKTGTTTEPAPAVGALQASQADSDVVVMEPFHVRAKRDHFLELEKTFRAQEETARTTEQYRRLGIASHTYTFGRHRFTFGYSTLFWIPVSFGFGF